ncbi:DNA/RNA non-specific endonuclease [Acuticoccus sediminis]|uniref:DNA/RNA non-specific endonuclease n=1 Tax=Acuticoccus sediminis TaxID=2184697 RepID=UPI001CFD0621|nr:DNA/RNA non-specific endonuclease [Acuticoccus sediminis]
MLIPSPTLVIGALLVVAGLALLIVARSDWWGAVGPTLGHMRDSFSWPKLAYSVVLLSLVAILLSETGRLWLDRRTVLGAFQYYSGNTQDEASGKTAALRILDRHGELRRKFADVERSSFENEQRLIPVTGQPIAQPESVLQDVEIKVQEINLTDILARVRRWFTSPREIKGTVSVSGTRYNATLTFADAETRLKNGDVVGSSLYFDDLASLDEVVEDIACTLIWMDAAREEEDIATVGRDEFCNWTRHWSAYQSLAGRLRRNGRLGEDDTRQVRDALQALGHAIERGNVSYPKYWSLRADFVDLLPDEDRARLVEQKQRDWLTYYALLRIDPRDRLRAGNALTEEEALIALAQARPALVINDGELEAARGTLWEAILDLERSRSAVRRAAIATGLFRIVGPSPTPLQESTRGVGFAIAPNLIATAEVNIVAPSVRPRGGTEVVEVPDDVVAEFVFADQWPQDGDTTVGRLPIRRILYLGNGGSPALNLAILEIEGHDTTAFPPLEIDLDAAALELNGFVCLVGFPENDSRLPRTFMQALLGKTGGGHKRIMPGRVVTLPKPGAPRTFSAFDRNAITVDASTSGGTAGAPLIDLRTGRLAGVNFGGAWQNIKDGKFAYSIPIAWLFPNEPLQAELRNGPAALTLDTFADRVGAQPREIEVAAAAAPEVPVGVRPETGAEPDETGTADIVIAADPMTTGGYDTGFLTVPVPLPHLVDTGAGQPSAPLDYVHHTVVMNVDRRLAYFSAENIDPGQLVRLRRDRDRFVPDGRIPDDWQPDGALFAGNDLDRGQLTPRGNVAWGDEETARNASASSFMYTNVTPQHADVNRRSWKQLEDEVLNILLSRGAKGTIFSGPVFRADDLAYRGFKLPRGFWKILVAEVDGGMYTAAFVVRQEFDMQGDQLLGRGEAFDVVNSRVSVADVEALTGLDFGPLRAFDALGGAGAAAAR